jgi:hypothetical protein
MMWAQIVTSGRGPFPVEENSMKRATSWGAFLCFCLAAGIFALAAAASSGSSTAKSVPSKPTLSKDSIVYVSDFDLDAQNVKTDKGGIIGEARPGILERPRKREQRDPEAQAKKLVDLMSTTLVQDLQKKGLKAQRLAATDTKPASGAWVHGVFTEVDEGNQRRRALIGFGAGAAQMDLYVTLSDLTDPDKPLYNMNQNDKSGKMPGAVITLNPYVAAAKFVLDKNAPEKVVKKTAGQVADQVAGKLKGTGAPAM